MRIDNLIKWILVLFTIYLIYQGLRILLGGSWGTGEFMMALIMLNLGWTMNLQIQISRHLGEHKGYKDGLKDYNNKKL